MLPSRILTIAGLFAIVLLILYVQKTRKTKEHFSALGHNEEALTEDVQMLLDMLNDILVAKDFELLTIGELSHHYIKDITVRHKKTHQLIKSIQLHVIPRGIDGKMPQSVTIIVPNQSAS